MSILVKVYCSSDHGICLGNRCHWKCPSHLW